MSTTPTTTTHRFEFFQGTSTESRTRSQITVRKGGLLVLTEAAARMLGSRTTHVQLAYAGAGLRESPGKVDRPGLSTVASGPGKAPRARAEIRPSDRSSTGRRRRRCRRAPGW